MTDLAIIFRLSAKFSSRNPMRSPISGPSREGCTQGATKLSEDSPSGH